MSYSLGDKFTSTTTGTTGTRKPGSIVSQSADRMATLFDNTVTTMKRAPILQGATYDTSKFRAAKVRADSTLNSLASYVGTTTLSKEDVQQLLLGGLGRIQAAARSLRVVARVDSARARAYEVRITASVQQLVTQLGRMAATFRPRDAVSGLGLVMIALFGVLGVAVLLGVIRAMDDTDAVLRELDAVCPVPPCTPEERAALLGEIRANRAQAAGDDPFGFKGIFGAVGTVIKVVGIGAAVAGGIYLLWTFGPALIGAGRSVRRVSKRKFAR